MFRKIALFLLWIGLTSYTFLLAPPQQPDTFELIKNLSTGNWEGINPFIISLFNLMGIWPAIYACLLLTDGREQKIKAFPFVIASFAVGAFAILPYLFLREPNSEFTGQKDLLLKVLDSRWLGVILTIPTLILLIWGFSAGNWQDFLYQWQTSKFIHVMSIDFCLLCLLVPVILGDDMKRKGIDNPIIFWTASLIPLLGILGYLCLRPNLPENSSDIIGNEF